MTFTLDPKIEADSYFVIDLDLSHVRLNKNAAFPWLILIPKRDAVSEIIDLDEADRTALLNDIVISSQIVKNLFQPKKLNVANLGNKTPQLHVHVIARYEDDKAWPGPVWDSGVSATYDDKKLQEVLAMLQGAFNDVLTGASS
jgi:diadenosine tetraphosphate (Ap4A) HIT family hydrolase